MGKLIRTVEQWILFIPAEACQVPLLDVRANRVPAETARL
jgi:hypothetical protein